MKKTILAAAVAAAVIAAPMTAADNVVIYGKIHGSIDYVDTDAYNDFELDDEGNWAEDNIFDSQDTWAITDRSSHIGFKGSEDLGSGLKAIWKVEVERQ